MQTATNDQALVLASSGGIGFAIAQDLIDQGYDVILHSRGGESLSAAKERLPGAVANFAWDLTAEGDTQCGIGRVLEAGFRPRVLVYNCGGPPLGGFDQLTNTEWHLAFQSILLGVIEAVQALHPVIALGGARVIIVSSMVAREPDPAVTISSTLRAGLSALVKCMAPALAAEGATINAILPGYVQTERLKAFEKHIATIVQKIALRRTGRPEEVAKLVSFLASEHSSYITGQSILCDGGLCKGI